MKLGIVGAGAIGMTLAAALARAHDVVLLARRADAAAAIERDGVTVVDDAGETVARVRAAATPEAFADRDAVIVAVKAYATAAALRPLRGILRNDALIVSVQNGLGNAETAREALPGARVVAGTTMQGAIRLGDTRVRPIGHGVTSFARDDAAFPSSADLAAAFAAAGLEARVVDDVATLLWRKAVVNAAINPICALARRTNGDAVRDPDLATLARALAAEAVAVARAEGADVGDAWRAVQAAADATAANRNSMLQDLDAGRRTEIDAIAGAIAARAARHGIPVPTTETVLRLVRARERA